MPSAKEAVHLISSLRCFLKQQHNLSWVLLLFEFFRAVYSISSCDDSTVKHLDFISSFLCVFLSWKAEQWQGEPTAASSSTQRCLHRKWLEGALLWWTALTSDFSGGLSFVQRLLQVHCVLVLFRTRQELKLPAPWLPVGFVWFYFGWFYFLEGESFPFSSSVDGFTGFWSLISTPDFYFFFPGKETS